MTVDQNQQVVVGVFEDRNRAEQAVDELRNAGFSEDQIGFATRGENKGAATTEGGDTGEGESRAGGALTGAVSGGILGGIIGAAASLLIPGIGPVLAGGILASALTGAAVGAAAGGILGALTKLGVPEEEAQYYQGEFEAGRTIVTVQAGGRSAEATEILRRNGAYDATTRNATGTYAGTTAQYGTDQGYNAGGSMQAYDTTTETTGRYGDQDQGQDNEQYTAQGAGEYGATNMNQYDQDNINLQGQNADTDRMREGEDTDRVQLREEQLDVQKRSVETGEVRIGKEIITEEKTINVPVQREEVVIERHGVGNRPSDTPIGDQDNETIRIPVREEQIDIQKRPVVTEEVNIGKRVVQDNRQVTDTVRREEARLEQAGDVNVQGADIDQRQPDA